MKWKKSLGLSLLILGVGLLVLSSAHLVSATSPKYNSVTDTYYWKNIVGQTIVTTKLTDSWEYKDGKITWYNSHPDYTFSKAWWVIFAYDTGVKSGVIVDKPGYAYHAYGTAHYYAALPSWWGPIVVSQDVYSKIYFFGSGSWSTEDGLGYVA